jgi:hypothetical protein
MSIEKPTLEQFKSTLKEIRGQSLTTEAAIAAHDFMNRWDDFLEGLKSESVRINVDMSKNFPEYKQYKIWKGLSKIIIVIGLILIAFSWKLAIPVVVLGIGLHFYGNIYKASVKRNFLETIKKELNDNPLLGMTKICEHYMAGTIQLTSSTGTAYWPQYPSNAITGEQRFIPIGFLSSLSTETMYDTDEEKHLFK